MEIAVTYYSDSGCVVTAAPIRESNGAVTRPQTIGIKPDLVIIRNQPRGPTPGGDRRSALFGLMTANVPSMNTLVSEFMQLERPVMNGALREIEKRVGHDRFPFIGQVYYSGSSSMVISPELPAIIKVSHAHRGMGKIRVETQEAFRDVATVLALHEDYCTGEHFIEAEYGIRVQKIGEHYRVMKKVFTGSGWKSQFGGADLQEIALTPQHKLWADECSKLWSGLDWCAVDGLHGKDGRDYVIELNGSAIGLLPNRWLEDTLFIRDLVIKRLHELGLI